ncbi:MAG: GNAT family N-acetyltransferase [Candidatus Rokuibacteriota bacterium]|nr:MAG: GNAT family N-acetyltransferase [Candidatus Rokubacteria bacterium]
MREATADPAVVLREAEPADAEALGPIVFEAFASIHDHHRFPRDFPSAEVATAFMGPWIANPSVWGVVAEVDGRIVGSNFLYEADPIAGVGPITVDPEAQNKGVGRKLMEAVVERGRDARGVRLVQDGFHMRSLALYLSLGFDVTASCVVVSGSPRTAPSHGVEVRPLTEDDLAACEDLCQRVHRFERTGGLRDAMRAFTAYGAFRKGRLVAYASTVTFWQVGYGVGETEEDLMGLLAGAAADVDAPLTLLVPLRSELFRWSLENGLRCLKPMNVMARGEYQEPRGAWFPSVLY